MSDGVEYPLIPLVLGLIMHCAARRVASDGAISMRLWPSRSLIAGRGQSIDFSRLALWRILEKVHADYMPKQLESWVDDLHHLEMGLTRAVEEQLLKVSLDLPEKLRKHGFKLAAKSAMTSNLRSWPSASHRLSSRAGSWCRRRSGPRIWALRPMAPGARRRSCGGA